MKIHSSFTTVLRAAQKQARQEPDPKRKESLKQALENLKIFQDDNYDFIMFYGQDADMK